MAELPEDQIPNPSYRYLYVANPRGEINWIASALSTVEALARPEGCRLQTGSSLRRRTGSNGGCCKRTLDTATDASTSTA